MPRERRALLRKPAELSSEFETPAFKNISKFSKECNQSDSDNDVHPGSDISDSIHDTGEDSDDAPEDIGFKESREEALSQMKDVLTQLKEDKLQLKLKRKQKQALYTEQKKKKLEKLDEVGRLPEEVINSLPEELPQTNQLSIKSVPKRKQKRKSKLKKFKHDELSEPSEKTLQWTGHDDDFIPLEMGFVDSKSSIKVMPLNRVQKKMSVSQTAANFRNQRLYGDTRRRESTQAYLAKEQKRKANKMRR